MIAIRLPNGKEYSVTARAGGIELYARPGMRTCHIFLSAEQSALYWLCDHSLEKSKARQLLDAEIRNEGPMANPRHRLRILSRDDVSPSDSRAVEGSQLAAQS